MEPGKNRPSRFKALIHGGHPGGIAPAGQGPGKAAQSGQTGSRYHDNHGRAQNETVGQHTRNHGHQGITEHILTENHQTEGRDPRAGKRQLGGNGGRAGGNHAREQTGTQEPR